VGGPACGGVLVAYGKAKTKEDNIKADDRKLKIQGEVERVLAGSGYFGKCTCGQDYFFENGSPAVVKCSCCVEDIVLFILPGPDHWDALADAFAFKNTYGRNCAKCEEFVYRTPEYEIMPNGQFSTEQTGGCATTLHDKCGTTMCIGGNPNCGAFLKSIRDPEEVHHVTDHFCHCYGPRLFLNGTCSVCEKCRLYSPMEHWCYIFLQAKAKWYTNHNLPVPAVVQNEIYLIEKDDAKIYF
jgi:hypothetical protein